MPRIPDELQRSVVFIYPDCAAAKEGQRAGGSGFLLRRFNSATGQMKYFVITNTHVAQGRNRTLHIAAGTENSFFYDVPGSAWVPHSAGDDISSAELTFDYTSGVATLDWSAISASKQRLDELNAGVGDDVFMLGRFLSHNSLQIDQPLARFGNIAMMPGCPIRDGRGIEVEAFLIEMRSLSGFSGSPVFVYMGPGTYRGNGTMMPFFTETIGLIGIDTGHKTIRGDVRSAESNSKTELFVPLNTGIAIVSPVWRIEELLDAMSAS